MINWIAIGSVIAGLELLHGLLLYFFIAPLRELKREVRELHEQRLAQRIEDVRKVAESYHQQLVKRVDMHDEEIEEVRDKLTSEIRQVEKNLRDQLTAADTASKESRRKLHEDFNVMNATLNELKGSVHATNAMTSNMLSNALNQLVAVSKETAFVAGKTGA
jgi:uncharacterized coiled-coil DUF342 family protein